MISAQGRCEKCSKDQKKVDILTSNDFEAISNWGRGFVDLRVDGQSRILSKFLHEAHHH
jgi:hypothetical protein